MSTTTREQALLNALQVIVRETMDYPPVRPVSTDSWLPAPMVEVAQAALDLYGLRIESKPELFARGVAA